MDELNPPPRIASREAFADGVRWGVAAAVADGTRQLVFVDPNFELWPLDDTAMLDTLTQWLKLPQRRLVLLAAGYDEVPRRQPRFTAWRVHWAHALQCLQSPQEFAASLPTLLEKRFAKLRVASSFSQVLQSSNRGVSYRRKLRKRRPGAEQRITQIRWSDAAKSLATHRDHFLRTEQQGLVLHRL